MCGIAGAIALRTGVRPDLAVVKRMNAALAHRGPDGEGIWIAPSGEAILAHMRLAVIDLVTGDQPIRSVNDSLGLVFNGEIYNYRELRGDLERRGHRFRTVSDTEVLLESFVADGPSCTDKLRGMFVFALWDEVNHRLTLARDRVGKKPCFYTVVNDCLYFASSLQALRHVPRSWSIDLGAVDLFQSLGYIPAPHTIFDGVYKIPAGRRMQWQVDKGLVHDEPLWALESFTPYEGSYPDAVDRLEGLLQDAVDIRLRSDVPLGVFLSGGIDSSLIAAMACRRSGQQVQTFTIGFDNQDTDESQYAEVVARHLGTDHRAFHTSDQSLELLPQLVAHYGEPYGDPSALPVWQLAEMTRQHVTVALGGDGGDEGFAGYDWYRNAARLTRWRQIIPSVALRSGASALTAAGSLGVRATLIDRALRGFELLAQDTATRFAGLRSFMAHRDAAPLYATPLQEVRSEGARSEQWLTGLYHDAEGSDLRRMQYVDIRSYLAECLMPKTDVATMAHGLEARAPLLDQEVLKFALSLPPDWLSNGVQGKRILRSVLTRYLPDSLFARPKHGFDVPLVAWFTTTHLDRIQRLASRSSLLESGWFQQDGLQRLIDEQVAHRRDHSQRLYNLLVLDLWLDQQ